MRGQCAEVLLGLWPGVMPRSGQVQRLADTVDESQRDCKSNPANRGFYLIACLAFTFAHFGPDLGPICWHEPL